VLGRVPKRIRRRVTVVVTVAFLGLGLLFLAGVAVLEGVRLDLVTWLVIVGIAAIGVGAIPLVLRTLSTADRAIIEQAERRRLPPLPCATGAPSLLVALHPGFLWRRRLEDRPDLLVLEADSNGMRVPGWLFLGPTPGVDRFAVHHLPWSDITRFQVQADSDGPDVYTIEVVSQTGYSTCWRVLRRPVTDEIALLDQVRSVGALTVELEASVMR